MSTIAPHFASARFRETRTADWQRLEMLVGRLERGRAASLSDDDLLELPVLYRAALSSLSVTRETSLDADLVAYLESLCARAYFVIYGVQPPFWRRVRSFFASGWPIAIRALVPETLVAVAMTVLGAVAAYFLVRGDPAWFHAMVPDGLSDGRGPQASAAELRKVLYDDGGGNVLGIFATYLFTHNSQIALMCFALGFAFGVPTLLLLVYNGCILGGFVAIYAQKGMALQLLAWLAIHGTTELFAIVLAGAAGLRIGMAVAFPGRRSRTTAATDAGRIAAQAMLGVVVMLGVAGLLEGIGRQVIQSDGIRTLIGAAALTGWLFYFYLVPVASEDAHG